MSVLPTSAKEQDCFKYVSEMRREQTFACTKADYRGGDRRLRLLGAVALSPIILAGGLASVGGEVSMRENQRGISISSARERVYKAKPKGESL